MRFKTPAVAVAGFLAGALTIPSVVGAQSDETPPVQEPPEISIDVTPMTGTWAVGEVEPGDVDAPWFGTDGIELPKEVIEQLNQETDKIIEALRAAGLNVGVTTDESGLKTFELADDLSEAEAAMADEAIEGVLRHLHGDGLIFGFGELDLSELGADWEQFEPTAEELADWNAETDKLIEALTEAGIPVERMDDDGVAFFDIPGELTEAQEAALEEILGEQCGVVEIPADDSDSSTGA